MSIAALVGATQSASAEQTAPAQGQPGPELLTVNVQERYPHDTAAFTQGLELVDDVLYESTGLYNQSDARIVDLETGAVQLSVPLPAEEFAEGLTVVDDTIWQITWQEHVAIQRDRETLAEIDRVEYTGEGWGLCYDSGQDRLVMSDGGSQLTFRDPQTFDVIGQVDVSRDGEPVMRINELECVDGQVWANIWLTDEIVRIDPGNGSVTASVDAAGLLTADEQVGADVLNGIAAVDTGGCVDTYLITGKLWPWMFLVTFEPAA